MENEIRHSLRIGTEMIEQFKEESQESDWKIVATEEKLIRGLSYALKKALREEKMAIISKQEVIRRLPETRKHNSPNLQQDKDKLDYLQRFLDNSILEQDQIHMKALQVLPTIRNKTGIPSKG